MTALDDLRKLVEKKKATPKKPKITKPQPKLLPRQRALALVNWDRPLFQIGLQVLDQMTKSNKGIFRLPLEEDGKLKQVPSYIS